MTIYFFNRDNKKKEGEKKKPIKRRLEKVRLITTIRRQAVDSRQTPLFEKRR